MVEADENVRVLNLTGQELTIVKPLAEVEHQFDVTYKNGILEFVRFLA